MNHKRIRMQLEEGDRVSWTIPIWTNRDAVNESIPMLRSEMLLLKAVVVFYHLHSSLMVSSLQLSPAKDERWNRNNNSVVVVINFVLGSCKIGILVAAATAIPHFSVSSSWTWYCYYYYSLRRVQSGDKESNIFFHPFREWRWQLGW